LNNFFCYSILYMRLIVTAPNGRSTNCRRPHLQNCSKKSQKIHDHFVNVGVFLFDYLIFIAFNKFSVNPLSKRKRNIVYLKQMLLSYARLLKTFGYTLNICVVQRLKIMHNIIQRFSKVFLLFSI